MTLEDRIGSFVTAVGTDVKTLFGRIGNLAGLATTDKTSLVAAINEVHGAAAPSVPGASETVAGVAEIATQAETDTATDDARFVTPLKLRTSFTTLVGDPNTDLVAAYNAAKA